MQPIGRSELDFIRSLGDFDLRMFLSELHDHGWQQARKLLPLIREAIKVHGQRRTEGDFE
jgi:hypothetical protein